MARQCFWVLFPASATLLTAGQVIAVVPQTNYLGAVTGKDVGRSTITVQTDSYQWCCGGDDWEPCDYLLEARAPNQDAFDAVAIGDEVEVSALGSPGDIGGCWVSMARLTSRTGLLADGLYGDPEYLASDLEGGHGVAYTNEADCESCTNGGLETPCMCPAVATRATLTRAQAVLKECTLVPGQTCVYEEGGDRIDIAFHEGELHAFPVCTDEPCAGPQAISNFTVRRRPTGPFIRGDANADGDTLNISDGVYILQYLFIGGSPPSCEDAADANDNGQINLTDAVYILQHLFTSGSAIPPPAAECGFDPTGDELTCVSFSPCE